MFCACYRMAEPSQDENPAMALINEHYLKLAGGYLFPRLPEG